MSVTFCYGSLPCIFNDLRGGTAAPCDIGATRLSVELAPARTPYAFEAARKPRQPGLLRWLARMQHATREPGFSALHGPRGRFPHGPGFLQRQMWGPRRTGRDQNDRRWLRKYNKNEKIQEAGGAAICYVRAAVTQKGARAGLIRLSNGRQEVTMLKQAPRGLNLVTLS